MTFLAHDLGDFQTPPGLVTSVLAYLQRRGKVYERVLEPTCGTGTFIAGLLHMPVPPVEIQAIEWQQAYADTATTLCANNTTIHIVVQQANLFHLDLNSSLTWKTQGNLLVVGNPPWVTNATLGSLGSNNLPKKENLKRLRGIDARTGSSNFDIAESIWLKLITELRSEQPTIALLCKISVARNVLKYCYDMHVSVDRASIVRIDARKWFDVSVDACLFCIDVGTIQKSYMAHVYSDLDAIEPETTIGIQNGHVVAHIQSYDDVADIDGICSLTWRQGIKHDAASVMELVQARTTTALLLNKLGEYVDVEEEYVYPLLKGTDVFKHARLIQRAMDMYQRLRCETDNSSVQNGSSDSMHTVADRLEQLLMSYQTALPQTGQVKMNL